ncbi:MAG: GNAT family N-acetyltransferase [Candidatus Hodarchaeales archaeon]|jgi:GNAT superfamily N-acetyltransferase
MSKELFEYSVDQSSNLIPMFNGHKYLTAIINSSLQEQLAKVLVDDLENPTVCLMSYFAFAAISGDINSQSIDLLLKSIPFHKVLLFPPDDSWYQLLKAKFGMQLVTPKSKRTKFSSNGLNVEHVRSVKKILPEHLKLEVINEENANLFDSDFKKHFFDMFGSKEVFLKKGFGYVILDNDKVVGATATGNIPYNNAFEIQIVVDKEYRRQGFATLLAANLIEYSLENGYDPRWDADNDKSTALALKLGYTNPEPWAMSFRAKLPLVILRKTKIMKVVIWVLSKFGKDFD